MNETDSDSAPKHGTKRRRLIVFLILLAGCALIAWLGGVFDREPLHKGKPISYWVDRACTYDGKSSDGTSALEFRQEVKSIGATAVPYLVEGLRGSDRSRNLRLWIRDHVPSVLGRLVALDDSVDRIRFGAARTLASLGPDAEPAVPDLVRLLPTIGSAVEALTAIGPNAKESLPALRNLLQIRGPRERIEVAEAIWRIGHDTNLVLEVCTNAMIAGIPASGVGSLLSELGPAAAPAGPFALRLIQNTYLLPATRCEAAKVLAAARVDSPEIRTALLSAAETPEDPQPEPDQKRLKLKTTLRSCCGLALWRLDPQYAPLATRLAIADAVAMRKRFPLEPANCETWIEANGLDPQESVPALKQLLGNESLEIRNEAAETIKRIEARSRQKP